MFICIAALRPIDFGMIPMGFCIGVKFLQKKYLHVDYYVSRKRKRLLPHPKIKVLLCFKDYPKIKDRGTIQHVGLRK